MHAFRILLSFENVCNNISTQTVRFTEKASYIWKWSRIKKKEEKKKTLTKLATLKIWDAALVTR